MLALTKQLVVGVIMAEGIVFPPKFCQKCQCVTERIRRGQCKQCAKEQNAAYRVKNAEKIKASHDLFASNNPDKVKQSREKWIAENPDAKLQASRNWRINNPEKMQACRHEWEAKNLDRARKSRSDWKKSNRDAIASYNHNRRARKLEYGGKLSTGIVKRLLILQKGLCPCCGAKLGSNYHLDHITPLYLGGTNTDDNVQLLKAECNLNKSTKHPIDFMQERGFLL